MPAVSPLKERPFGLPRTAVANPFEIPVPKRTPFRFGSDPLNPLPSEGPKDVFTSNSADSLPKNEAHSALYATQAGAKDFFHKLDLMKQLTPQQRQRVFDDLRTRHVGFWRRMLPASHSVPSALEAAIDQNPLIVRLTRALEHFGETETKTIRLSQVDQLLGQIQHHPQNFGSSEALEEAKTLVSAFPILQHLSKTPGTLTAETLQALRQDIKDTIPFYYETYGQSPQAYVDTYLFHLGAASAMPHPGTIAKAGQDLNAWLNESPTYRKLARWAKDNQLSDAQFLPFYSFVDALYGQTTAFVTGLSKTISVPALFEQMVALDGLFNGIGFWTTKLQILLVGWDKEKPDRQRAQFEKEIREIAKEKHVLAEKLEQERAILAEKIKANPDQAEALSQQFDETVMTPMVQKTKDLAMKVEKTQRNLNKLLGIEKMGFFEKLWKKPPQLLSDLKVMVPISIPLTVTYEWLYVNRYTDYEISPLSGKFALLVGYMTLLSAGANVILKQIIHITQERAKLYLEGRKDELLALESRDTLARMKGMLKDMEASKNPAALPVTNALKTLYASLALPLIGTEADQAGSEKTLTREAKLQFSMDQTDAIKKMQTEVNDYIKTLGSSPDYARHKSEYKAAKSFRRYLTYLHKALDRAAYVPMERTRFELKALSDYYRKEMTDTGVAKKLLPKHDQFFIQTLNHAEQFLADLSLKYPRAEQPFEPLLLKADRDKNTLDKLFTLGIAGCKPGSPVYNALETFKQQATTPADRQLIKDLEYCLRKTQKGLTHDLTVLHAKSKDEARADVEAYRALRKAYAEETRNLPWGWEKLQRNFIQAGMALKQTGKNMAFQEKYNSWLSGIFWTPAHSLLNVAGRIGFTSIVQGQVLPFLVMLKVWALFQMPYRLNIFFTEKFMVKLDEMHRKAAEVKKQMDPGMETYLKQIIAEGKSTQA